MSLDTILGTGQCVEDLILPFLDNASCLKLVCVSKERLWYRSVVVNEKYGHLKKLRLNDKKLTCVSVEINGLVNLTVLSLHHNQLTKLPDSFGNGLVNLRLLLLDHNQLTEDWKLWLKNQFTHKVRL